jgi:hypothetical protein
MDRDDMCVTLGALAIDAGAPPSPQVGAALMRLATMAYGDAPDADTVISGILALLVESLGVDAAFLARVDGDALRIERAYDRGRMDVAQWNGAVIPLCDTY